MKWIIVTLLLVPLLLSGQAFYIDRPVAWYDMLILQQPNNHSVFHPQLTEIASPATYRQLLVTGSNPFMLKGLNRLAVDGYQNLEHAAWGLSCSMQGGGPVSSLRFSADYSQKISSSLTMGLGIHGSVNQWQGYQSQKHGGITGKLIYRISPKTAWTSSIGLERGFIKTSSSIQKSWSTEMGQSISNELFIAIRLEKEDNQDPAVQMLLDWKLDQSFVLQGGLNIATGNMMIGWHHQGKQNRKGLIISHHPLLGYGLEIFFCHGWN